MILFAKISSVILALLVISKTYLDYKKGNDSLSTFLFWSLTWIIIVLSSFEPDYLINLTENIGGKNGGMGTILGIAFMFLFFVVYRIYIKANRLEKKIHDIVMKQGLKDIEKN